MNQISIPAIASTFVDGDENPTFHVQFPYTALKQFHQWCEENNIGYKPENRKDVVKSDCHVFCKLEIAKEIFPLAVI